MCNFTSEFYSVWAKGTALYAQWAGKRGIGYPELIVLYALYTMGNLTQKEIREGFGLLKQTVNTVVRDLKKRELVILKACKEDKREKLVVLTEQGEIYSQEIIQPLLNAEERICKKLGYKRMKQAQETMELFNMLFENEVKSSKLFYCCSDLLTEI